MGDTALVAAKLLLNSFLGELSQKTDNVVVVSDSCHSGTITRGKTFATRGAPRDARPHPLGALPVSGRVGKWLSISACRDTEEASEYPAGATTHGLFTWFWAQALRNAVQGESWRQTFDRAAALIALSQSRPQHPHIEGDASLLVFGGRIETPPKTIAVKSVLGNKVTVDAGALVGLTPDSLLRKFDPQQQTKALPTVKLTQVEANESSGLAEGAIAPGDLLLLEEYGIQGKPINVLVRADLQEDAGLAEKVAAVVKGLPSFALVESPRACDLTLQILRPKKQGGRYAYAHPNDSLPRSFPDAPAECWALTPDERLYDGQERLKMRLEGAGIEVLKQNLLLLARTRNMLTLAAAPGQTQPVELTVDVYAPATTPAAACAPEPDYFRDDELGLCWKRVQTLTPGNLPEPTQTFSGARLLRFVLTNVSKRPQYTYLVNITDKGDVQPFYPGVNDSEEEGLLAPGASRRLETSLELKELKEYVRLITSLAPVKIQLLRQDGYAVTRGDGLTPLETLLAEKAGHTRGAPRSSMKKDAWSTVQMAFELNP